LKIHGVERVAATLSLKPTGASAMLVSGRVKARVVQTDVVTLEPVAQAIDEEVDLTLVPAEERHRRPAPIVDIDAPEADEDTFSNGRIDLGDIVSEHVALALDPYPRAAGVEFEEIVEDAPGPADSPFAALSKLKRDPD
jgi:uncharacterized metal-binding protein YceD (DUF177 family)